MEYLCHLCKEWYDATYCESHFQSAHGQDGVTFEKLQKRMSVLGGLDTRDEAQVAQEEKERPVFVTNNFRHYM